MEQKNVPRERELEPLPPPMAMTRSPSGTVFRGHNSLSRSWSTTEAVIIGGTNPKKAQSVNKRATGSDALPSLNRTASEVGATSPSATDRPNSKQHRRMLDGTALVRRSTSTPKGMTRPLLKRGVTWHCSNEKASSNYSAAIVDIAPAIAAATAGIGGLPDSHMQVAAAQDDDDCPPETLNWGHDVLGQLKRKAPLPSHLPAMNVPRRIPSKNRSREGSAQGVEEDSMREERHNSKERIAHDLEVSGKPVSTSKGEKRRLQATFERFKIPQGNEVEKALLPDVIHHLGHMPLPPPLIRELADEVEKDFSGLGPAEFQDFMGKFARCERSELQELFAGFDTGSTGKISAHAAVPRLLAVAMGVPPARKALREALAELGAPEADALVTFEEFMRILAIFRRSEGFTDGECQELQAAFMKVMGITGSAALDEEAAEDLRLPVTRLATVLAEFGGPRSWNICQRLGKEAATGRFYDDGDFDDQAQAVGLTLSETLVWARRLREAEVKIFSDACQKLAAEGSNPAAAHEQRIEPDALQELIRDLGYTLLASTVDEVLQEAVPGAVPVNRGFVQSEEKEQSIDFVDFVDLMMLVYAREGFNHEEIEELEQVFKRFDDNNNSDVEYVDLCDMLRYMGHRTTLAEANRLLSQLLYTEIRIGSKGVSELSRQNGSSERNTSKSGFDVQIGIGKGLDWRYYLRFMRLHREEELRRNRAVFEENCDNAICGMPAVNTTAALVALGYSNISTDTADTVGAQQGEAGEETAINPGRRRSITVLAVLNDVLDFDAFCALVDQSRMARMALQRRCAGFSEVEVDKFRKVFGQHENSAGCIESSHLAPLLRDLGFKTINSQEQAMLLEQIEVARDAAVSVGVESAGEHASPFPFWVLVQLMRILYARDDKRVLDREARAVELTRFTETEVEEFRGVFMSWFAKDMAFSNGNMRSASKTSKKSEPRGILQAQTEERRELSKDCMRRLLRSLGVNLEPDQKNKLERKIDDLGSSGRVDFADFLKLMRWMLDTNFADITTTAAKATRS